MSTRSSLSLSQVPFTISVGDGKRVASGSVGLC